MNRPEMLIESNSIESAYLSAIGICCGSLKDDKILMKMGLGLVLVGHVNFLLGALVHGAVLRHIKVITVDQQLVVYPISNIISLVAGLMVCRSSFQIVFCEIIKKIL